MTLPFRPSIAAVELVRRSEALFAWSARDGGIAALSGQAPTFVRATDRTQIDGSGKLYTVGPHIPGIDAVLNTVTGLYEPTLALEPGRTNLVLQSENFGTTWVPTNTPTRVAAAKVLGDLSLDLLGDDSAALSRYYQQSITLTGNGLKAVSIYLKQGTILSANGSAFGLYDETAGVYRARGKVTWSGGVPTVTADNGTHIGSVALADGVYRLLFQSTSATAANPHTVYFFPANNLSSADVGNVYAGGVMVENAPMPSSYVKTTTAIATRNGEALSYPVVWPMQDNETWYVRMARPRWADLAGALSACYVVSRGSTTPRYYVYFSGASRLLYAELNDGTTAAPVSTAIPAGTGGFIDVAIQFGDLRTGGRARIDTGSGYGSYSAALPSGMSSVQTTLGVGDNIASPGEQVTGGFTDMVVVSGLQTFATMRGLAGR